MPACPQVAHAHLIRPSACLCAYSVGLLALEQGQERTAAEDWVNLYIFAAGLGMIGLGVLYAIMVSATCFKPEMYVYMLT